MKSFSDQKQHLLKSLLPFGLGRRAKRTALSAFLVICILQLSACSYFKMPPPIYPENEPTAYQPIPYTHFSVGDREYFLEIDTTALETRFVTDQGSIINIPDHSIPVGIQEWGDKDAIIARQFFTEALHIYLVSKDTGKIVNSVQFSNEYPHLLLKNTFVLNNCLYLILFDSSRNSMRLQRLSCPEGRCVKDEEYEETFLTGASIDSTVLAVSTAQVARIVMANKVFNVSSTGHVTALQELPDGNRGVELTSHEDRIAVICQKPYGKGDAPLYFAYDLTEASPHLALESYPNEILYNLRWENQRWIANSAANSKDYVTIFKRDITSLENSGVLFLGSSNMEGRVVWAQCYYLNGFLDLYAKWEGLPTGLLDRELIRDRIEIELRLLDHLASGESPGLLSMRYSGSWRTPRLYASHISILYNLFHRYQSSIPQPIQFNSMPMLANKIVTLDKCVESIATNRGEIPSAKQGDNYFAYHTALKTAPAYNLQNVWAAAYTNIISDEALTPSVDYPFISMVKMFFDNTTIDTDNSWDSHWPYELPYISKTKNSHNKARLRGENIADKTYRTIDAIDLLTIKSRYPAIVPDEFEQLVFNGVTENYLYPYASRAFYEKSPPPLSLDLAASAFRPTSTWEIINSAWGLMWLSRYRP